MNGIGGTGTVAGGPLTEPELIRGYGPADAAQRQVRAVLLQNVVEERIRELLGYRRWYRQNRWAEWSDLRTGHDRELRSLLRLVRLSRRLAEGAPDPVTLAGAADWTESERAWGR